MWYIIQELFKEKHYADLDGGILEGFGRLLKYDLKLYVYPTLDEQTGELVTAETLQVTADFLIVCNACHYFAQCVLTGKYRSKAAPGWGAVMQHTMMRLHSSMLQHWSFTGYLPLYQILALLETLMQS